MFARGVKGIFNVLFLRFFFVVFGTSLPYECVAGMHFFVNLFTNQKCIVEYFTDYGLGQWKFLWLLYY